MIISILLTLSLGILHTSTAATTTILPQIDFNSLGSVGLIGDFAGLSFYSAPSSPASTANASSSDNPVSTLISRNNNGQLSKLASTNPGGKITTLCQMSSGRVVIGGQFTSIAGVAVNNIATYEPISNVFTSLGNGVDGPVSAIECNTSTIYVGGTFKSPIGLASTSGYAGNVASWSTLNSTWSPLPFAGLNGPVRSISSNGTSLLFGGSFSTIYTNSTSSNSTSTSTDVIYPSLGSSLTPISLNTSEYIATPTTYTSGFGRPQSVFCPQHADGVGASWLLTDGATGSFIVRLFRPLNVGGIRLGNTFFQGRGTANFTFISIPDDTIPTLTYRTNPADPNSPLATCSRNCPLSNDPTVPYQDFLFPPNTTMTGFEIDIFGFYGAGAGLHLMQLLSDGAFAYAVAADNTSPCVQGLGATVASNVSTTGNWTVESAVTSIPGTVQAVLQTRFVGGIVPSDEPTLTWTPYVLQSGIYHIYVFTPSCSALGYCIPRAVAALTVQPHDSTNSTMTLIDQQCLVDQTTLVYSGPLSASTSVNGGVSITMTLANGGASKEGVIYQLVAEKVSLVAQSTNGSVVETFETGYGLYEYNIAPSARVSSNASAVLTNASMIDLLATKWAKGGIVNSVIDSNGRIFVGGAFNYTNGTTSSSLNVLTYANSVVTVSPNGGLNGVVMSLTEFDGWVYAIGAFTGTADGKVVGLAGSARWQYGVAGSTWSTLGPSLAALSSLGLINNGSSEQIVAIGSGLDIYDPSSSRWNSASAGLLVGNVTAFGAANSLTNETGVSYLAGQIIAMQDQYTPGGAMLSTNNDGTPIISPFGFQLKPSTTSSNSTSSLTTSLRLRSLVAAYIPTNGFTSTLRTRSVVPALMTTLPSALSLSSTAQILAGAFWTRGALSLYVLGGSFTTSTGISNIAMYDSANQNLTALSGTTIDGVVLALSVPDSSNTVWVGGEFTTSSGREGLTTYDLLNRRVDESQPALEGYPGVNLTVNVITQRPGYDNIVIVGGVFASAGSLPCSSICQWDTKLSQWSSLGMGLIGVVGAIDFAGTNSQYLIAAGSFTVNGTATYLAQYDFVALTWSFFGSATALPGPATAVSSHNAVDTKVFVAGLAVTSNEPYLFYWNGTTWTDLNHGVVSIGSGVQQLVFVPLSSKSSIRGSEGGVIETDRMLLVSGDLKINNTRIASALFDGVNWYPYLVASNEKGGNGVISKLFYSVMNFNLAAAKHLAVGLVILISMAISLGIVFLLVLIGILIALSRRNETSDYPAAAPAAEEIDPLQEKARRPDSLLAAVGAATAVLLDAKKQNTPRRHSRLPSTSYQPEQSPVGDETLTSHEGIADYNEDDEQFDQFDSAARVRYSFAAEHPGELTVTSGEDLVILEASDVNWWLVANATGARGLIPASYLA